jgi:hypothetical protein
MKGLKEMLVESTVNEARVNLSDNIRDFKSVIMPGQTDTAIFGVIVGKPFKYGDKVGRKAAEDLVRQIGLPMGNDFDDIIYDFEEEGYQLSEMEFCYFMSTEGGVSVDCYSFGDGGVYIIK